MQTDVELQYPMYRKHVELMKTKKGKEMGKERLEFMEKFRKHWIEETDCTLVL